MLNATEISAYYDGLLEKLSTPTNRHIEIFKTLNQIDLKGCEVLDIGCGTGITTKFLSSKASQVTGIDISPVLIDYARKTNSGKNVGYVVGDICEWIPVVKPDFICLVDVLEHIPSSDIVRLLYKLEDIAKNTTRIYLNIPSGDVIQYLRENHPNELQIIDEPHSIGEILYRFEFIGFVPYHIRMFWGQYMEYLFWKKEQQRNNFNRAFSSLKEKQNGRSS